MATDGTIGGIYRDNGNEGEEARVEVWYGGRCITELKPVMQPSASARDEQYVADQTIAVTLSEIFKWWRLSGVKALIEAEEIVRQAKKPEDIDNQAVCNAALAERDDTQRRLSDAYEDRQNHTAINYAETMHAIANRWFSNGVVEAVECAAEFTHAEDHCDAFGAVEEAVAAVQAKAGRAWLRQRESLVRRAITLGDADTQARVVQALTGGTA